ncbi:hypothetical protein EDB89DRAFT_2174670 [Lactarius sanguifluus]|nr:hypothetical protein EDB89DRAFT_2174670 [Lactarius sanguifluus]
MTFAPRAARSPFDSPPRAAHRVRPQSPLEGCLGIESFGGYFTVFQILPQRYRVPARQALLPPVHIHYHLLVGGFLFRAAVPRLARYNLLFTCVYGLFFGPSSQFPTISGMVLLLYAIRSDCQHCPCAGTSLLFLYAIGSGFASARAREKYIGFGCAIAHAQENSRVLAIGSVLSLPSFQLRPMPRYRVFHVLAVFSVSIRGSDPAVLFDRDRYFQFIRLSACHLRQRHYFLPSAASSSSAAITGVVVGSVLLLYRLPFAPSTLMPSPLFRPLSFVAISLPRSRAFAAKTLYGPCYLLRYYTARFTSRRRAWLAHYRELLAQIGRVSQTFTYAVVPGAVFIVPSLGQIDKLPAFPASCHRDGHSVVVRFPIGNHGRVSARRGIARLFGRSISHGDGHRDCMFCSTLLCLAVSAVSHLCLRLRQGFVSPLHALLRDAVVFYDQRVIHGYTESESPSNAEIWGILVRSARVIHGVWVVLPVTFICTPCPSISSCWMPVSSGPRYASCAQRWTFSKDRVCVVGWFTELRELPLVGIIRMLVSSVPISEGPFVVIACFAR